MTIHRQAAEEILRWRKDALKFVREVFHAEPDGWQAEALASISSNDFIQRRRLVLKSCTGAGKSTLLAWIGWHRLFCFWDVNEYPKGVALSGEGRDNLRDNLWSEISKWRERSGILSKAFTCNQDRIASVEYPSMWFMSARSYAKDADTEAIGRSLSGLHSKFPFILLDEIGDMPLTVGQKASQIFTGGVSDALIAAAGNPTSTTGLLYHASTMERELWKVITITADPDDPKRTPRVDLEHAKEQIKLHGRDNPWIQATILGEFPSQGFNTLLSVAEVEAAMNRHITEDKYAFSQKRLGVDVARFGDDRTVIFPRQGLAAFNPAEMRNARTTEIAARIMEAKNRWKSEAEFIDDTGGFGGGVIDALHVAGVSTHAVQFSGKAIDTRYQNKRAEMWFEMADWVKRGGCLPYIPAMIRELTSPTYTFVNGKFALEPKEKIKERLKFSPDYSDALACTFAIPDMASRRETHALYGNTKKLLHDYDPLSRD